MPYTVAWEESVPAGTAQARDIDLFIQNDKIAVRERMQDMFNVDLRTVTTSDTVYVNELRLGPVNTLRARIQAPSTDAIELRNAAGTGRANLRVGNTIHATGVAGTNRGLMFQTATVDRFFVFIANDAESGGNAGSTFAISSYTDSGTFLRDNLTINRATGLVSISGSLQLGGSFISTNISTNLSGNWRILLDNSVGINWIDNANIGRWLLYTPSDPNNLYIRDTTNGIMMVTITQAPARNNRSITFDASVFVNSAGLVGSTLPSVITTIRGLTIYGDIANTSLNGITYQGGGGGGAAIAFYRDSGFGTGIIFGTNPIGGVSGGVIERVRIEPDGIAIFSNSVLRVGNAPNPSNLGAAIVVQGAVAATATGMEMWSAGVQRGYIFCTNTVSAFIVHSGLLQISAPSGVIIGNDPGGTTTLRVGVVAVSSTTIAAFINTGGGGTTGFYVQATGALGSTGIVRISASGDANKRFILQTGNTDALEIDPNGRVIIGTDPGGTNILRVGGSITASGNYRAGFGGGIGHSELTAGTTSFSGFVQFSGPNGTRIGYIGFGANTVTSDAGTIPYVAGTHAFTGNVVIGTDPGGSDLLRVGGNIYSNATIRANQYNDTNNNRLLTTRITGWTNPSGISSRASFDPSTVTLVQLGERVSAVIRDLLSHGLIST